MKQLTQNTFTKGATQYSNIASPMDSQETQLIQARKSAKTGNLEYMTANSQQYTELLSKAQHIKSVDTIYTDSSNLPSVGVSDGDILPALTSNALPLKLYVYDSSSAEWSVYSVVQASALYYADDKDALLIATSFSPYFLSVSDLSSCEKVANKVTSLSAQSTDTEYPSAKCVYDIIGDVDTLLTNLNSGGGVQPTPQPLPVEYFEFVSGTITGFSSAGQTAYNNGEITALILPSEDSDGNPVTSTSWYVFQSCTSLTSITIPSSVTSIGKGSFSGCTSLTSITVEPIVPPVLGSSVFDDTNDAPIYVPAQSVTDYQSASDWSDYSARIQAIQ